MGQVFQFKQFAVDQNNCPMRINTDGVLLGAITNEKNPKNILDLGTGTGVIALMLAQQYTDANVWAVEIDHLASETGKMNFANSPFTERMNLVHTDIFQWNTSDEFDLIVSNPPFYINSLHNPDERKKIAKHADDTFFNGMMQFAHKHLSEQGNLQIIVPIEHLDFLLEDASANGLHLNKQINIHSFDDSDCFRCILKFSREDLPMEESRFVIYKDRGVYSEAYKGLLQPYFLAF